MKRIVSAATFFIVALALTLPAAADRQYKDYHGYRDRPYDKHRHYKNQHHRGHKYHYRGHWRSWDDWDRYYRDHPRFRDYGRYYWEGEHLMFRLCDPDRDACVFFSIGR